MFETRLPAQPGRTKMPSWTARAFGIGLALLAPITARGVQITGNLANGKALFEGNGKCLSCHSIEDHGGSLGPDLSKIGVTRSLESLRLALVNPDQEIYKEYLTVTVVTKRGQTFRGIGLNEDDLSIQIRDVDGNPRSFLKDDLRSSRREARSLMPSFAARFSAAEIDDLVAYLRSLRGPAPPAISKGTRKPNRAYSDVAFLDRIGRDSEERPDSLIKDLEIPAGASVAEVGSGTGYFTWRLAQTVGPTGKVVAVDIQQAMLDRTAETLKKHQLTNVQLVLGDETDPHLPAESLDLVLIANAYHGFNQPDAIIRAVKRALKPSGRLVIVEFAEGRRFDPSDTAERMTAEQIRAEIEPLGFELDRELELLEIQHGLVFSKLRVPRN